MGRRHHRVARNRPHPSKTMTEPELLAILERHGFMEVRDGQDQGLTDPRQDGASAVEGGVSEAGRAPVHV